MQATVSQVTSLPVVGCALQWQCKGLVVLNLNTDQPKMIDVIYTNQEQEFITERNVACYAY